MISLRTYDAIVIGGGPAGLPAAIELASCGAKVALIDREDRLGGQLTKQTHMFFGSQRQRAGTRGVDIAGILAAEALEKGVEVYLGATVLGYYDDRVIAIEQDERFIKMKASAYVVATGASEKMLAFPNNDKPGVYGAGAIQTLMNVHGVMPGRRALMVGAGNIGLIISYQLVQAGVEVAAIVEAAPRIGGYWVHASKVRRLGIPVLTSHTVTQVHGGDAVEKVTVARVDESWSPVPGTERDFDVDVVGLAVGLSPLAELLWQAGCAMRYIPALGGHVPVRNENLETSVDGLFVAGDVAGVEEASSAMLEGRLAGLAAALKIGQGSVTDIMKAMEETRLELESLRAGPVGQKIRKGLEALAREAMAS